MMGLRVELTSGHSIAVRSQKRTGAAVVVDLDGLLAAPPGSRTKALRDATDQSLTGSPALALRNANSPTDVVAALDHKIDRNATPDVVPPEVPVLQPTDERRRTGSHYTPRSLTEPIVSEALRPVLERLGAAPGPEEILDLKILDPATGSGAFLVEACRQLAERLVESWSIHGGPSDMSAGEDEMVNARRLVAQRCLYGVDRNPMAIDLARLSLWLATFAKDHEFTFIDHALRHGDSLVGLTRQQIEGFHWKAEAPKFQIGMEAVEVRERVRRVFDLRQLIREVGDGAQEHELRELLEETDRELRNVRQLGNLILAAFFGRDRPKARELRRREYADSIVQRGLAGVGTLSREIDLALGPFHWEIEFPEVFDRENPGFDAILGNPPFAGKNTTINSNPAGYLDWLKQIHPQSHGNADLVAHFFRRAFGLIRENGTLGLVATNTIAQGDTRASGLRWICNNGGAIYRAHRRIKWPGEAAVVVSVVHVAKGELTGPKRLDSRDTDLITAFLFYEGGHDDPERLIANAGMSFQGSIILGMGFTFDDTDKKGVTTPLAEMRRLIHNDPRNREVILPYIGGQEVNSSPKHAQHRYVINFGERDEAECRRFWPDVFAIVEERVKPERLRQNDVGAKNKWWQFIRPRPELRQAIADLDRVLVISQTSKTMAFLFLPTGMVYSHKLVVFPFNCYSAFSVLQARTHEIWARFFGSTMKDDAVYTPSDCFETFPFPEDWETHAALKAAGKAYYEFRAALMVENDEGMTKAYNRFHDPEERSAKIADLRELHAAMDRAVLDAYGWHDISTNCEFLLDYEIDEAEWGRKKKPWRHRWPDEVRDEVLARLMALNAQRALEERVAGGPPRLKKAAS